MGSGAQPLGLSGCVRINDSVCLTLWAEPAQGGLGVQLKWSLEELKLCSGSHSQTAADLCALQACNSSDCAHCLL